MNRFERWSPLVGVLTVALWIAGIAVISHNNPADHATDGQILAWYKSDSNWVLFGGWLFMLGSLAFLWFAVVLRERMDEAGAGRKAARLTFAGAIAATVFGIAIPLTDVAAAINKNDISAATAGAAHRLVRRVLRRSRDRPDRRVPRGGGRGCSRRACCPSGGRG